MLGPLGQGRQSKREKLYQPNRRYLCPKAVTLTTTSSMLLAFFAIGSAVAAGLPQAPSSPRQAREAPTATAVPARQAPAIDGKSDDAVWREAPRVSGFRQFQPHVDTDPSYQTEFQVAFDEKNLYVFVRMFE